MRTPGFSRLWLVLALACLVALVYWPSTAVLVAQWSDFVNITYTHGWLVLAVCGALVLRARREIDAAPAAPAPAAMFALLSASFVWLVCYRASIQDLHITIFPALFWLAVTAAFGTRVGLLVAFPIGFFYFAVPSWSQLADPLQHLTVAVMRGFLAVTGPPALIDGPVVRIPNGAFVVEEGCSGLHFMIVGLAVAALHGYLQKDPWRTRLAQLALMAGLALLANWLRVYTVIEAGYLTDMHHYLVSVSHYWFGWGVFALALVAFFWLSTWLPAVSPVEESVEHDAPKQGTKDAGLVGVAVAAVLLLLLPGLSGALRHGQPPASGDAAMRIHPQTPWTFALGSFDSFWMPAFQRADATVHTILQDGSGSQIEVFAVTYVEQHQGAELVGGSSSLLGPHLKYDGEAEVGAGDGRFHEYEALDPLGAHSLVWFRYEIGGRRFTSGLGSQLWYGLRATVAHPSAALVAGRAECTPDCDNARHSLGSLVSSGSLR